MKALVAATCIAVLAAVGYFFYGEYAKGSRDAAFADPAVKVCEAVVLSRLKSPASYRRDAAKLDQSRVVIAYDAVNQFNAPLRGYHTCTFKWSDGEGFRFAKSGDVDQAKEDSQSLLHEIEQAKADGTLKVKFDDLERRRKENLNDIADSMLLLLADFSAAEGTGLQPIAEGATALRPDGK